MATLAAAAIHAFSLLVPPRCVACGCEPRDSTAVLCPDCQVLIRPLGGDVCSLCALPSPCSPCPAVGSKWESAGAAFRHGPEVSSLVVAFKQSGARKIAGLMSKAMIQAATFPDTSQSVLVPVPMDPRRKRKTGVDHAHVLARTLARRTGRPLVQPLLRKSAPRGIRQAGSGRRERLELDRIRIEPWMPSPRDCLVIDDVHTTGATLRAVVQSLVAGGAERVRCMTFARALPPAYAGKAASSW